MLKLTAEVEPAARSASATRRRRDNNRTQYSRPSHLRLMYSLRSNRSGLGEQHTVQRKAGGTRKRAARKEKRPGTQPCRARRPEGKANAEPTYIPGGLQPTTGIQIRRMMLAQPTRETAARTERSLATDPGHTPQAHGQRQHPSRPDNHHKQKPACRKRQ